MMQSSTTHQDEGQIAQFLFDGERYSAAEMIAANIDDEALCEWIAAAQVGDRFPAFISVERVA